MLVSEREVCKLWVANDVELRLVVRGDERGALRMSVIHHELLEARLHRRSCGRFVIWRSIARIEIDGRLT